MGFAAQSNDHAAGCGYVHPLGTIVPGAAGMCGLGRSAARYLLGIAGAMTALCTWPPAAAKSCQAWLERPARQRPPPLSAPSAAQTAGSVQLKTDKFICYC